VYILQITQNTHTHRVAKCIDILNKTATHKLQHTDLL